mmetsp:Transcript_4710/g.5354  ORF Transcript_4710/g.5354 Transcript_4710/m.5354 type:complete len:850 (+) Transcript_4710:202-2751(+)|eukprot:CAMPEP_0184022720 /NCGR_PEP_ID=MMETSP0954-20121128/10807_1 /TAXON_ID=627963 /ORGANISM="Aplanochytrium sp, Strain PBS07" /LENGTH=849 /DNA_ID=CAMNT_0026305215 /DNA_START=118 /DNA_END=2667 /DNA_ORIENTATION=+
MAEARNAIDLYYLQKRGFHIAGVEDGYYTVSLSIPYPQTAWKATQVMIRRGFRSLQNRIWPATPSTVVGVMGLVSTGVVTANSESWVRSGWLADQLWKIDTRVNTLNPVHKHLSIEIRVGYLAAIAAFVGMLGIVSVERTILRALLSYKGWLYMKPKQKTPLSVMLWGGLVAIFSGGKNLTYGFSLSLPALPLPSLSHTCDYYLASIKPLMDDEEYQKSVEATEAFKKNEGRKFQWYLWFKHLFSVNYLAEWWEKYVYLRGRTPLMVNSNYYILDSKHRPTTNQLERAGNIIHNFLLFKDMIENETLEPMLIRGKVPLCMEQYERMFGTCRIPGRECDSLKHNLSRYIVVVHDGKYYKVDVYHGARGTDLRPFSTEEIQYQLGLIMEHSKDGSSARLPTLTKPGEMKRASSIARALGRYKSNRIQSYSDLSVLNAMRNREAEAGSRQRHDSVTRTGYTGPGIAAFTAGPRSNWAEARELYFSEGENRESLVCIEKAAFLVFLENESFSTLRERAKWMFHGNGYNRWFDKSLSLVVMKDGYIGLNCEHSWADAPAVAHLWEWALISELIDYQNRVIKADAANTEQSKKNFKALPPPKRLVWAIDDELRTAINQAGNVAEQLIEDVDLDLVAEPGYGTGFMKKSGFSPDAYIQMVLQLAYYRNRKQFDLTYESSMTRLFRLGRTETIRSLTEDSKAWVLAMESSDASKEEKIKLMRSAAEKHVAYSKMAMAGQGIDRHLFALYIVSRGMDINSEFLNNALTIPWRLSTSQQPQQQTNLRKQLQDKMKNVFVSPGGGFGPVADDGYGVSYMIVGGDKLFFHVSSKISCPETSSAAFCECLRGALKDVHDLLA